ncbi:MAG: MFS transporter [Agarilytica sp.]
MFRQLSPKQRWQFLLIIAVAFLYFASASMMLYFPKYIVDLGGNEQQAGWLSGVSLIPMLLFSLFIGSMSDKYGSKTLVMSGLILFSLSTYLQGYITDTGYETFCLRFLQGMGHALVFSPLLAEVARIIPDGYRAAGIGYFTVSIQAGNTLGSSIGELCIKMWSYTSLFNIATFIGLTALIALFGIKSTKQQPQNSSKQKISDTQQTTALPNQYFGYLAVLLILGCSFGIALQFMPIYFDFLLREELVQTPISNLYFMTSCLMTVAMVRLFIGHHTDGIHRDKILKVCFVVMLFSLAALPFIRSEFASLLISICFGLSYGLIFPSVNAQIIEMVDADKRGKSSGILAVVYEVGFRGMPVLAGSLVFYIGYTQMFYTLCVAFGLSILFLLYTKRKDKNAISKPPLTV